MTPAILRSKIAVLVTISKVIQKYQKYWCYASQNTILELLDQFHNVTIHRRMLNYHLADIREEGLIKTIGRTHRNDDGTICLLSSATCLTIKGALFLYRMGSAWALRHMKSLKEKYQPEQPKDLELRARGPADPQEKPPRKISKNPFLDRTLREKMGLPPDLPFDPDLA